MDIEPSQTIHGIQEERGGLHMQEPQRRNARQGEKQTVEERCRVATRCKAHELPPPIRGMVGHERFNMAKILEAPVTLKVQELFDIAPIVRRQIANEMKSSEPQSRAAWQIQSEPTTVVNREAVIEPAVMQTVPKRDVIPECLYITAWINGQALPRTLVDSGAVVNLISPQAIQKAELRSRLIQEEPWGIQLASDDLVEIKEYVDIKVNVAGVEMPITAYVTGIGVMYDLLLSR